MLDFVSTVLIILSVSTSTYCEQISYDNYKVFRLIPKNTKQIEVLHEFENKNGFSFWKKSQRLSFTSDLLVAPTQLDEFYELSKNASIKYEVLIENVQDLMNQEISMSVRSAGDDSFNWTSYNTLDEIYSWMDKVARKHPRKVKKLVGGRTFQGRKIQGLKLSFGKHRKPGIFIEGGVHPREWISSATVTYLIDNLLNSKVPEVRQLAEAYDWYMFPNCNPDGYVYTHTVDRMWRKTLSDTGNAKCKGVDLNRNFDYRWTEGNPDKDPCSIIYAGKTAFSEIESKSLSEFIKSLSGKLFAYISFHSYTQLLLLPFGHTAKHLDNYNETFAIGSKGISALSKRYGTKYKLGDVAELIYVATGNSMDWVKGVMKLPLVYTYEMRDTGKHGFLLPPSQIIPNSEEILDSFVAMFKEARKFGYPKTSS